jgi:hypothetical protein
MRDAGSAADRISVERFLQFNDFAQTANAGDRVTISNGNTCRVVTTIFEPAQAFH